MAAPGSNADDRLCRFATQGSARLRGLEKHPMENSVSQLQASSPKKHDVILPAREEGKGRIDVSSTGYS